MVGAGEANKGVEWRVTVAGDRPTSAKVEPESGNGWQRFWAWAVTMSLLGFAKKIWRIGADDPRKVIHGLKVGLALSLVSFFYYTRPLYEGVGGTSMWAIMTVVVVFEFSVGGCIYKGFNRASATFAGGALALAIHFVASKSEKTTEPIIHGASIFLLTSAATFSRFLPAVKARFDYGITIFILTFSLVSVSGYRVENLVTMAQQRLSTISIGISISFMVCVFICPVWSGVDLHRLVVRNMEKLSSSLEACMVPRFEFDFRGPEQKESQKWKGYKCVLNSKAAEDSLANLATWEPGHGSFGFRHPWKQYLMVSVAMRNCAYCLEALDGCVNSNLQAPEYIKKHLGDVCMRLSSEASKVLNETASSIKSMRKSPAIEISLAEMNGAVEDLHTALRTLPDKPSTPSPAGTVSFMEAVPLIAVASILIELAVRVEGVVDAAEDLAELARFKDDDGEKPEQPKLLESTFASSNEVLQEV